MPFSTTTLDPATIERETLALVREMLNELGSRQAAEKLSLGSTFDRDLGLGSLERVELLVRTERRFDRRLPDELAQRAETLADWARAIEKGGVASAASDRYPIIQPGKDAPPPPTDAASFLDVLRRHAQSVPDRVQVHLLEEDAGQEISYGRLLERSSKVAAGLAASGLKPNETVAIMLPTCDDFFYAFFGVMLAGAIAVPIYPPARPDKLEEYVQRQVLILRNAEIRFLISFDHVKAVSTVMGLSLPSLIETTTVAALARRGQGIAPPGAKPADAFFIQYTSGSTGNPKGVVLTHENVLANVQGIGHSVAARPDDIVVSWLPLYHDMGLIGSWLFSVFYGFPITAMSPLAFLSRPERWPWAMSDSGGTLCPAPNFSYELCARKITDDALAGVDLSRWRVAINAGEPVLPRTLDAFAERFAPYGFRRESFIPCYGLAESSVALTFPSLTGPPLIDSIVRDTYETEGHAVPAGPEETNVLRFVANGIPLPGHEVRVVDDTWNDVAERHQGRIVFRGPSKTSGYFRNPEATRAVVNEEGFMDSGDLGYLAGGELYVTGRLKDCIIKAGHNIIPQDVEFAAADVEGVRKGCVAAFGTVDAATATERLVVVAETRVNDPSARARIEAEIIKAVGAKVGLPPDVVKLVPPQTVPKTSSGKIRRNETRTMFENDALHFVKRAPWLQIVRLWFGNLGRAAALALLGIGGTMRRAFRAWLVWKLGYGFGMVARVFPSPASAQGLTRTAVRWLLASRGVKPRTGGLESIPAGRAVLIANRAGKFDALVTAAAIPGKFLYANRMAFEPLPPAITFLLDPLVVPPAEEITTPPGGTLRERIQQALERGHRVLVFAEGPAGVEPERSRYRLEAIQAAHATAAPIVPLRISGSAHVFEDNIRAANTSAPKITAGSPMASDGDDPRHLVEIRDQIRRVIASIPQ